MFTREELLAERERRRRAREAGMSAPAAATQRQSGGPPAPISAGPPKARSTLSDWRPEQIASAQAGARPGASAADRLNAQTFLVQAQSGFSDVTPSAKRFTPEWQDPQLDRLRQENVLSRAMAASGAPSASVGSLLDANDPAVSRIVSRDQPSAAFDQRPFMPSRDFQAMTPERQQAEVNRMASVSQFDQQRRQDVSDARNRAAGRMLLDTGTGPTFVDNPAVGMGAEAAARQAERNRQERREAARVNMGDMIVTQDALGRLQPGTDVDRDIGKGLLTAPVNIANAAISAGESAINLPIDAFNAMADKYYSTGNTSRDQRIGAPRLDVPEIPLPEELQSATGALTKGLAQFLIGRGAIGKALPGGGLAAQIGKDALTVGTVFDGSTGRIADMIDPSVIPEGPLRDYAAWLRTQPDDSELVGRFKNFLEDMTVSGPFVAPQAVVSGGRAINRAVNPPSIPTNAGGARLGPPPSPRQAYNAMPEAERRAVVERLQQAGMTNDEIVAAIRSGNTEPPVQPTAQQADDVGPAPEPAPAPEPPPQAAAPAGPAPFSRPGEVRAPRGNLVLRNADRVVGGTVGGMIASPSAAASAGDDGSNNPLGTAGGVVAGALLPRFAAQAGGRTLRAAQRAAGGAKNANRFDERIASSTLRKQFERAGLTSPAAVQEAMRAAFGNEPATLADLTQEGLSTAVGLTRLPGSTAENAAARAAELADTSMGRTQAGIEDAIRGVNPGLNPGTIAGDVDELIAAAQAEASPLYQALRAQYPLGSLDSGRLMELLDQDIMRPHVQAAQRYRDTIAISEGRQVGDFEFVDIVKRSLDDAEQKAINRNERVPYDLESARVALLEEMDRLVPRYAEARRLGGEAPRMRQAFSEGQRLLQGRFSVEDIGRIIQETTGAALTATQAGVIRAMIGKVETGRGALQALTGPGTRQKLARVFGQEAADAMQARFKAEEALMRNARQMDPNVGSVTSRAMLSEPAGIGPMIAEAVQTARNPLEAGLAYLSKSGAYSQAQRDLMGEMLLGGATDANLARIFPPSRTRPPRGRRGGPPPAAPQGGPPPAGGRGPAAGPASAGPVDDLPRGPAPAAAQADPPFPDTGAATAGQADPAAYRGPISEQVGPWNGPVPKKPQSLIAWIKSQGGIKDTNYMRGDLRSIMGRSNGMPGLLNNKSGVALDELARKAYTEGFDVNPEDANSLMRLIDEEFDGNPSYRIGAREQWDIYQDWLAARRGDFDDPTSRSPAFIGGAGVGALTGAAMNPDDPAAGALIGAGVGGVGVAAAGRMLGRAGPPPRRMPPGRGVDAMGLGGGSRQIGGRGSAAERFSSAAIKRESKVADLSRSKLIEMPIDDFLRLARKGNNDQKLSGVKGLLDKNEPFESLPYLMINRDGSVRGHEGRHRARALKDAGYDTMPVIVRSENIRWSEQGNPNADDYVDEWPRQLTAEAGAESPGFAVPFPISREQATQPYRVGSAPTRASSDDIIRQAEAQGYTGQDIGEAQEWVRARAKGLDMSQPARLERARAMGFDTERVLYHGTTENITSFDLGLGGKNTGAKSAKSAIWLSNNPEASDLYTVSDVNDLLEAGGFINEQAYMSLPRDEYKKFIAEKNIVTKGQAASAKLQATAKSEGGSSLSSAVNTAMETAVRRRDGNKYINEWIDYNDQSAELADAMKTALPDMRAAFLYDYKLRWAQSKGAGAIGDELWGAQEFGAGPNILPVYVRLKNPLIVDQALSKTRPEKFSELIARAKENGHDGLIVRNTFDPLEMDAVAVFNPANIRSVNAAFDPAEAGSRNILAGMVDNPAATGALAGGAAGVVAPYDTDGDGVIDANDRAASVIGNMITGGVGGAVAGRLMPGAARRGPPTGPATMGVGGNKGPLKPSAGNKNKLEPAFRSVARLKVGQSIDRRANPPIVQKFTPNNAAKQLTSIDRVLRNHPVPEASSNAWSRMMAEMVGDVDAPAPPYKFIKDMQDNAQGAVARLKTLTREQIAEADHGFLQAEEFRQAYADGMMQPVDTTKLFMWSFLSRGVSPYVQESMFLDAFRGADQWIKLAVDGKFDAKAFAKYKRWASKVSPKGRGLPGSGTQHNLNAFGKDFLFKMSAVADDGRTYLQKLHDMFADPDMTGPQIRRAFAQFPEGIGIDNKVLSFTLLASGRKDVMVLDRIQVRSLFNDGRFGDRNIYDPLKVNGKAVSGTALAEITYGPQGLVLYEAIERALSRKVDDIYTAVGRPQDASIGRYHWDTWNAASGQEASHATLSAILNDARKVNNPTSGIRAKEGEYGAYAYNAEYGIADDGVRTFQYTTPKGNTYEFTVPAFRDFLNQIKKSKNKVVPSKFKVTDSENAPWTQRPEVNIDALEQLAAKYADRSTGQRAGRRSGASAEGGEAVSRSGPYQMASGYEGLATPPPAPGLGPQKKRQGPRTTLSAFPTADDAAIRQGPTFYSALTRAVEKSPTKSAPASQWKSTLANSPGIKAEEIEWTGVNDWLDLQQGNVTRDELAAYLQNNGVQVEEVVKVADGAVDASVDAIARQLFDESWDTNLWDDWMYETRKNRLMELFSKQPDSVKEEYYSRYMSRSDGEKRAYLDWADDEFGTSYDDTDLFSAEEIESIQDEAWELTQAEYRERAEQLVDDGDIGGEGSTKWSAFKLPGGQNYSELLITLPAKNPKATSGKIYFLNDYQAEEILVALSMNGLEDLNYGRAVGGNHIEITGFADQDVSVVKEIARQAGAEFKVDAVKGTQSTFRSSHWEEPNVLAHVRFSERTSADGKRILAIDEIQSDWHQAGREKGYRGTENYKVERDQFGTWRVRDEAGKRVDARDGTTGWDSEDAAKAAIRSGSMESRSGSVPNAPFKNNAWASLSLKRMIRHAAENGFDEIAWNAGQYPVRRFSLAKQVDSLSVTDAPAAGDDMVMLAAYKNGRSVLEETIPRSKLKDYVGAEAAEKVLAKPKERITGARSLDGVDLNVGGAGMKAFYDQILVNEANKIGKKYGVSVKTRQIDTPAGRDGSARIEAGPKTFYSMEITPKVRKMALEGQPLFAFPGAGNLAQAGAGVGGAAYGYARGSDLNEDGVIDDQERMTSAVALGALGLGTAGLARMRMGMGRAKPPSAVKAGPPVQATTSARSVKPPEVKGPPGDSMMGSAGRAIGTGAAAAVATSLIQAAQSEEASETDKRLEAELAKITQINAQISKLMADQNFFSTATAKELQERLAREGFNLGPSGIDGRLTLPNGQESMSGKAINQYKAQIEERLRSANELLKTATKEKERLERQRAFERTQVTPEQQMFRDFAPLVAFGAGALGAKGIRFVGSKMSERSIVKAIEKANALLNDAPLKPNMSDKAFDRLATNLNEFYRLGGAKPGVPPKGKGKPPQALPLENAKDGTWRARPTSKVMPSGELFPDKRFKGGDVLLTSTGLFEAFAAGQDAMNKANQIAELKDLLKDEKNQTEANLARLQELEDAYATSKAYALAGLGLASGTIAAGFIKKYPSMRATAENIAKRKGDAGVDIAKSDRQLANIRRYLAAQKTTQQGSAQAVAPVAPPPVQAGPPRAAPLGPPSPKREKRRQTPRRTP